ncbi:mechanosensitive ion channel family protein [Salinirubrum litoreum]|uniref:Mechanosensitive ion channel family protein n=1 Tax=Salinirubrum litoreum TaxID=1126234 RepID=A0ABD5R9Z9_9EURY|nr:mechanosensitive ion channel family protein [Salinirubrum litoreum]
MLPAGLVAVVAVLSSVARPLAAALGRHDWFGQTDGTTTGTPDGGGTTGTPTPTPGGNTTAPNGTGGGGGTTDAGEAVVGALPPELQAVVEALAAIPGSQVVAALIIVFTGAYLSKFLVRLLARPVARRFQRQSVAQTVLRGVRVGTVIFAAFVAADVLDLGIGNVVLSVTVFSAVLGIVLAPIVGSVLNGLFVLADQPYEIGDMVEFVDTGQRGFVEDITLRYTKVFTLDNTFLVLPNASIRERDVLNYSAEDERTRLRLSVIVTYESDIPEARRIIERSAANVDDVIEGGPDIRIGSARYPAKPTAYLDTFGDHGIMITLRYWAKRPYKLLTVRSKVQTEVWEALEDADVEIAYPHQHLVFDETSGEAQVGVRHRDGEGGGDVLGGSPPRER